MHRAEELRAAAGDEIDVNVAEVLTNALSLAFPDIIRRFIEVNETLAMRQTAGWNLEWYKDLLTCWARYIAMATDETHGAVADVGSLSIATYVC